MPSSGSCKLARKFQKSCLSCMLPFPITLLNYFLGGESGGQNGFWHHRLGLPCQVELGNVSNVQSGAVELSSSDRNGESEVTPTASTPHRKGSVPFTVCMVREDSMVPVHGHADHFPPV